MTASITEFLSAAAYYNKPERIISASYALWQVMQVFDPHGLVQVNENGQVIYLPKNSVNRRTSSLTRFIGYLSQDYPSLKTLDTQPIQDEIVKWASMELGGTQWSFEEVTGDALVEAYATGPYSCMRGRNAQLSLYTINPDKVALLKIYQHGKYEGRGLVWTTDDGRRFLDRIYPGNGTLAFAARRYAKLNGWLYKDYDGVGVSVNDTIPIKVTLRHVTNRRIPFLDTLRHVCKCDDTGLTLTVCRGGPARVHRYPVIGNYTGFCTAIYSSTRYLDGSPVVSRLVTDAKFTHFERPKVFTATVLIRNRQVVVALKSTDILYKIQGDDFALKPDAFIEIDGKLYRRTDVRKRRNVEQYTPKVGATAYVLSGESWQHGNGATIKYLEVVA